MHLGTVSGMLLLFTVLNGAHGGEQESSLKLQVELLTSKTVLASPICLRLTLRNTGEQVAYTYFKDSDSMCDASLLSLLATDENGNECRLKPLAAFSGPSIRSPGAPLKPGAEVAMDVALCLALESSMNSTVREIMYLPPGTYDLRVEIMCPAVVQSDPIEIQITPPGGQDRRALDMMPELPLYAQGGLVDPGDWSGQVPRQGKFAEHAAILRRVRVECPESVLVHWLNFWTAFKQWHPEGLDDPAESAEQASEFLRMHGDFPLADHLRLRAAKRYVKSGRPEQAADQLAAIGVGGEVPAPLRYEVERVRKLAALRPTSRPANERDPVVGQQ